MKRFNKYFNEALIGKNTKLDIKEDYYIIVQLCGIDFRNRREEIMKGCDPIEMKIYGVSKWVTILIVNPNTDMQIIDRLKDDASKIYKFPKDMSLEDFEEATENQKIRLYDLEKIYPKK